MIGVLDHVAGREENREIQIICSKQLIYLSYNIVLSFILWTFNYHGRKNMSLLGGTKLFLNLNPKRTSIAISTQTKFADKGHKNPVNEKTNCRIYT